MTLKERGSTLYAGVQEHFRVVRKPDERDDNVITIHVSALNYIAN